MTNNRCTQVIYDPCELTLDLFNVQNNLTDQITCHADCGTNFCLQTPCSEGAWLDFDDEATFHLLLFLTRYIGNFDRVRREQILEAVQEANRG